MQRRFSLRRVKHRITMVCSLSCSLHALFHDSSRRIFPFWKLRLRIWIVSRNDYYVSFWLIAGACSRKDQQTLNVNVDRSVFSFDNTRRWYFSIFFSLSFALSLSLSLSLFLGRKFEMSRTTDEVPSSVGRFRGTLRLFLRSFDDIFVVHDDKDGEWKKEKRDGRGKKLEGISIGRPISGASLLARLIRLPRSTRYSVSIPVILLQSDQPIVQSRGLTFSL